MECEKCSQHTNTTKLVDSSGSLKQIALLQQHDTAGQCNQDKEHFGGRLASLNCASILVGAQKTAEHVRMLVNQMRELDKLAAEWCGVVLALTVEPRRSRGVFEWPDVTVEGQTH